MTVPFLPRVNRNIRLRRLRPDDVDDFYAYRSDPDLARYQGWSAISRSDAVDFVAKMELVPLFPSGHWFQLAIADFKTDRLTGDVGLHFRADASVVEIGFTVSRAAQGQGVATAAAESAVELCWTCTSVKSGDRHYRRQERAFDPGSAEAWHAAGRVAANNLQRRAM
jgi:RimJ/RimL family protein N-acetyltransferase